MSFTAALEQSPFAEVQAVRSPTIPRLYSFKEPIDMILVCHRALLPALHFFNSAS